MSHKVSAASNNAVAALVQEVAKKSAVRQPEKIQPEVTPQRLQVNSAPVMDKVTLSSAAQSAAVAVASQMKLVGGPAAQESMGTKESNADKTLENAMATLKRARRGMREREELERASEPPPSEGNAQPMASLNVKEAGQQIDRAQQVLKEDVAKLAETKSMSTMVTDES